MIKVEELTLPTFKNFAILKRYCLTNHFNTDWEVDILVINQEGFSHEIEIKLSKSDFKMI